MIHSSSREHFGLLLQFITGASVRLGSPRKFKEWGCAGKSDRDSFEGVSGTWLELPTHMRYATSRSLMSARLIITPIVKICRACEFTDETRILGHE